MSGFHGDNMIENSEQTPWYRQSTFKEALNMIKPLRRPINKPLRILVTEAMKISGVGTVVVAKIEYGTLKDGQELLVLPSGCKTKVKDIQMNQKPVDTAYAGDIVAFGVKNLSLYDITGGYGRSSKAVVCDI